MGSNDDFGPDTDAIRRWLAQRDTYRADSGRHRGDAPQPPAGHAPAPQPVAPPAPHQAPERPARPRAGTPDSRDVGRSVLEALGAVTPAPAAVSEPHPQPTAAEARLDALVHPAEPATPEAVAEPEPAPAAPPPATVRPAPPVDESTVGSATDLDFRPRARARALMGVILLISLLATAGAVYLAATQPSTGAYGVAGTLAALALVVWAVRASTTAVVVRVHRGVLEVRRGGGFEVADLANPYTPIMILGVPERRNWRVLIERPDKPLLEIDASMVEPYAFTGLLLRLRPELWDAAVDVARTEAGITPPS